MAGKTSKKSAKVAKKAVAKKAPAKKAPAKKAGTSTRKATTTKAATEASKAAEVTAEVTEGIDDSFTEQTLAIIERLSAQGLSEEEIVLALAEARKQQG